MQRKQEKPLTNNCMKIFPIVLRILTGKIKMQIFCVQNQTTFSRKHTEKKQRKSKALTIFFLQQFFFIRVQTRVPFLHANYSIDGVFKS